MAEPYRIRLRGPWEYEWLEPKNGSERRGTVQMPTSWEEIFGPKAGRARFRRRFGRPTNLDPWERVFVVFEGVGGEAEVWLNDQRLGELKRQSGAFEITGLLQATNRLVVDISYRPEQSSERLGGLWGTVFVEIRQS